VLASVDFDDQPRLQATEVDDIIADFYLFAKLTIVQLAAAQMAP
jgi:hypothetical protein